MSKLRSGFGSGGFWSLEVWAAVKPPSKMVAISKRNIRIRVILKADLSSGAGGVGRRGTRRRRFNAFKPILDAWWVGWVAAEQRTWWRSRWTRQALEDLQMDGEILFWVLTNCLDQVAGFHQYLVAIV